MGWSRWISKAPAYVAPVVPTAPLHEGAGAAQHRSTDHKNNRSRPTQIDGLAQLPFVHQGHVGVVEVLDDCVSCPGNGNEHAQASQNEEHPAWECDARLGSPVIPGAGGALHAAAGHSAREPTHEDGQTHEGACRLDVWGQSQHGVICLALHVAGGLVDAVHPDAFPLDLWSQDIVADEGRDLPLRQGCDGDRHNPASHSAGEADQLHASVHHDDLLCGFSFVHESPLFRALFPLLSSFLLFEVNSFGLLAPLLSGSVNFLTILA